MLCKTVRATLLSMHTHSSAALNLHYSRIRPRKMIFLLHPLLVCILTSASYPALDPTMYTISPLLNNWPLLVSQPFLLGRLILNSCSKPILTTDLRIAVGIDLPKDSKRTVLIPKQLEVSPPAF